jgi:uncharacterized protein involved in exopolysaccharide biosynthesis
MGMNDDLIRVVREQLMAIDRAVVKVSARFEQLEARIAALEAQLLEQGAQILLLKRLLDEDQ